MRMTENFQANCCWVQQLWLHFKEVAQTVRILQCSGEAVSAKNLPNRTEVVNSEV